MKKLKIGLIISFSVILISTLVLFLTEKLDGSKLLRDSHTEIMFVWVVVFFVLFIGGAYFFLTKKVEIESKKAFLYLMISLGIVFILKLVISSITKGFSIDTGCFTAWAAGAGKNLLGFYTPQEWCDYPPLYISILAFCGKLTSLGIPQLIAIRLPALFAEIGISLIIYKIASKNFNQTVGIFLGVMFALNPLVIFDTSIWGQMDTVLAFFIVTAIYLVTKTHARYPALYFILSSIFFASAILIKPQALFFLPILLFALIKNKKFLPILYSGLTGIGTIFLIILPFDKVKFVYASSKIISAINGAIPSLKDVTHFLSGLPFFRDFFWLADLFMGTAGGYSYITVNAANTYFPFGKNWVQDSMPTNLKVGETPPVIGKILGLDYATFGLILVGVVLILAAVIYFKSNHRSIPWFTAIFLNVGIFMTATRMHERYMFTIVALFIIAFIYSKDLITPILGALFTLTIYINTDYVFTRQLVVGNTWIENGSPTTIFISILNLLGLFLLLALLLGLAFNNYLPILKQEIIKPLTRSTIRQKKFKK